MLVRFCAFIMIPLALSAQAQKQATGAAKQTTAKPAPTSTPQPQGVTVDGVVAMVGAGLSDDVIIARLRKEDKAFDLSPDDMIRLKKAKLSDAVLKVMLDPKAESKPVGGALTAPQPVILRSPVLPQNGAANLPGATPAPGTNSVGDVNDPMAPHDSGIYLYTEDREGKPKLIALERASYQGAKTGGMLPSAMTYGIVKAKTKAVIPGPRAGIRISDPSPVFYFYFDDKQIGLGKSNFGTSNVSSPNQFALLKLEVSKSNRQTMVGQFSALGTSSGSDAKALVPFKSERIRPGLYRVTVADVKSGEYCFLASSSNTMIAGPYGAYGAGAAHAAEIFDFGVSLE